ncbi:MAG: phosphoribosylpyrophosphate synthetase [Acidobacteria bacterium]|nr:MAG: phosphoribosylpyrophosphate synthetase [Acidobacteriota bacterium]
MRQNERELMLFAGNSNMGLAEKISDSLEIPLGKVSLGRFKDGEISCRIMENVRGRDVFLVQSTCSPVNDNIMELLVMLDAFKRASVSRITAVIPYFGYARQDRKDRPRVPISARLVANLIESAGADRIVTMDLHTNQLQGFFNVPTDHIYAAPVMLERLKQLDGDIMVVSPDAGGVERARAMAKRLNNASLAIIDKRREKANVSKVMHIIGDVTGKDCIIVDDIVDTAGTLTKTAEAILQAGARKVYAAISHPVLSPPALERIEGSVLKKLFVTDSIPVKGADPILGKIEVVTVSGLIGEAIKRTYLETSISSLFV